MRRGLVVATVFTCITLLGACQADDVTEPVASASSIDPRGTDVSKSPSPSSASWTSTPTATPESSSGPVVAKPERPADMDRRDTVGAQAAAEYYALLTPYVLATLDTKEWDKMSLEECNFCTGVSSDVDAYRRSNQHETGGEVTIQGSSVTTISDASFRVHLMASESASQLVDARGQSVKDGSPGDEFTLDILLHYKGGEWRVRGVGINEKQ